MTDDVGGGLRILGSLHSLGETGLVRIEDTVPAAPDAVWTALTGPGRLADWLGGVSGDLHAGGDYRGLWRVSQWDGVGRILTCEPPHHLVLVSREVDAQDEHTTDITITPDGAGSRIVVEESGIPSAMLAAYGAGTQVHVEDLEAHLAGRSERHTADRWGELFPGYQALPVEG